PQTPIRNVGTTLLLTPNINADRTVSIRILIEQSGISAQEAIIPIPSPTTGEILEANVKTVQSKTFSGTVIAKDNTAIAVGGLIEEKAGDSESKVPFLGDIPLLGFFFREDAKTRGRQELVVIIRPHIIATPTETSQFNQKFMREYSKHPNALNNDDLNIYSNPTGEHKDYKLEKRFKEYPGQDMFDWLDDDDNWE
ncbi:MAG: hypothetical protein GQ569_10665, partial [Methylococcaceae bacterium]|nr:hypothetical protein [Methylococcaceae bacterium]